MYDPDAGRHLQWGNKRSLGSLAPSPTGPLPTSFDGRIMLLWKSRDRYRHVVMHKRRVFPSTMQFRIRNAREHYLYSLTIGRRVRRNFLPSSYDKKEPRTSCPGLISARSKLNQICRSTRRASPNISILSANESRAWLIHPQRAGRLPAYLRRATVDPRGHVGRLQAQVRVSFR